MAAGQEGSRPSAAVVWATALRLPSLLASLTSVLIGAAAWPGPIAWGWLALTFAGLASLQLVANLVNDYEDFRKGADTAEFLGPTPVLVRGWLKPAQVKTGIYACVAASAAFAVPLVARGGPAVLGLGLGGAVGAVWYTAGSRSLAYLGLGDVAVFVLFGPASVLGTVLVQARDASVRWRDTGLPPSAVVRGALWLGVAAGLLVNAILVVNNLRDIRTDTKVNKATSATRMGPALTRAFYAACVLVPFPLLFAGAHNGFIQRGTMAAIPAIVPALDIVVQVYRARGAALNACLENTALLGASVGLAAMLGAQYL